MSDSPPSCFQLRVSLQGMNPDDSLQIVLPWEWTRLEVWNLLESVFPAERSRQAEIEAKLDLRKNPDLLEIFAVLLDAFSQWRLGYCKLNVSTDDGTPLFPSDRNDGCLKLLQGKEETSLASSALHLIIAPEYRAVDYAVRRGWWETQEELLEWLQALTLLYFLDKHQVEIPGVATAEAGEGWSSIASILGREGLAAPSVETGMLSVTESGRRFIGSMLGETESYIDRFDLFKDVAYGLHSGSVEFDTGRGEDLRAQIIEAEGLDPIRAVFLLRLYDGTFDRFVSNWQYLIANTDFFDEILEPAVNHDRVEDGAIGRVIEIGYALIEEREEAAREARSRQATLERFRSRVGLPAADDPASPAVGDQLGRESKC